MNFVWSLSLLKVNFLKSSRMMENFRKMKLGKSHNNSFTLFTICILTESSIETWNHKTFWSLPMASSNCATSVLQDPCQPTRSYWPPLKERPYTWLQNLSKSFPTTTLSIFGHWGLLFMSYSKGLRHFIPTASILWYTWLWKIPSNSLKTCRQSSNLFCKDF